jgi:hypothetical protein
MSTPAADIPRTAEELTPAWLGQALGHAIAGCEQQMLGAGQGFMGEILRLRLEHDGPALPATLIAKLPHPSNRTMGELLGVYEREIMFFRSFADDAPVRLPAHYFSDFDRDKGSESQEKILRTLDRMPLFLSSWIGRIGMKIAAGKQRRYVLLIEDLGELASADQLAGLDVAGCCRVLRALAPLHRRYWRSPLLQGHFWLIPLDADARLRHARYRQSQAAFAATMGAELNGTLNWLALHGETLTRRFVAEAPETLIHGDMRLDNVMFDRDGCAFIDWQMVRRAPGAHDVAYFLSGALSESASWDDEREALAAYHEALAIDDYPLDTLIRDYQRALLLNLANLASAGEVDLANERGNAMMSAWMRRLAARARNVDPATLL